MLLAKTVMTGPDTATIVASYPDAEAAAAAAPKVKEILGSMGPYMAAAPDRVTGTVLWKMAPPAPAEAAGEAPAEPE
eukprot:SAG22_NODE_522_length_9503_cov_4.233624_2_plen_77_part_00